MTTGEHDGIGTIAMDVPPLPPHALCGEVFERFGNDPDMLALPIVDSDVPVGLINRNDMFALWASPFGRSLYERKPVHAIMDSRPLVVDVGLHLDALRSIILREKPSALMRGFILTRDGLYAGVGTALSLLRLAVANAELRNQELQRAKLAAESASRSKSQFLANMSHELRTPLNAIIGFAEILREQTFGPIQPSRYVEYAGDIHSSGVHLLSLINDILDMAKIEAGRMELHEEQVDIGDCIAASVRLMRQRAAEAGVSLTTRVEDGLPSLVADERALRQILLNLVGNAVKFTMPGGSVKVAACLVEGCVELGVVDTGVGIAAEHFEMVMQPFGQIANEFTRGHPGTGLGLPLVRALADLHGARFELSSDLGRGTTARVRFPAERGRYPEQRQSQVARS
jgi:two-component system, cell cycle sensor histidine kinase PleC